MHVLSGQQKHVSKVGELNLHYPFDTNQFTKADGF